MYISFCLHSDFSKETLVTHISFEWESACWRPFAIVLPGFIFAKQTSLKRSSTLPVSLLKVATSTETRNVISTFDTKKCDKFCASYTDGSIAFES